MITLAAVVLALAQAASPAVQPDVATTPVVQQDPLAAKTFTQGWIWQQSVWSVSTADRKDLAGGRAQAQVGVGRWGFTARADASGLPGQFVHDKPRTYRSVELYVAAHRNLMALDLPQHVTCGPSVLIGAGVPLQKVEGENPATPKALTAGVGARCEGEGWAIYGAVGQHQFLPGVAALGVGQFGLSKRTAFVADGGIGAGGEVFVRFGFGVRLW